MRNNLENNSIDFNKADNILSYDPVSGIFIWKERYDVPASWNKRYAGKIAGGTDNNGYVRIWIERKHFKAHRLAFLLMTGKMPPDYIDHIDGQKDNNVWTNLRAASKGENNSNVKMRSNNTIGEKGVYWYEPTGKWLAQIRVSGRLKYLGYFYDRTDAHAAYVAAAIKYHREFANDGHGALALKFSH